MPPPPPRGFTTAGAGAGAMGMTGGGAGLGAPIPPGAGGHSREVQQQQQQQQRDAACDLETDDAPNERREEYVFADVLARVNTQEMGAGEAAAAFEEACWERAFELREEAASAVHRTVRSAELSLSADHLEAEVGCTTSVQFTHSLKAPGFDP
jgi:hypothetical protein